MLSTASLSVGVVEELVAMVILFGGTGSEGWR